MQFELFCDHGASWNLSLSFSLSLSFPLSLSLTHTHTHTHVHRVQSFRRSIRDSFRRRRSASSAADDRKKIAEALNAEAGIKSPGGGGGGKQKGHRPRASSEPNSPVDVRSPVEAAASSQVWHAYT